MILWVVLLYVSAGVEAGQYHRDSYTKTIVQFRDKGACERFAIKLQRIHNANNEDTKIKRWSCTDG
jgi:hypothetical protein